VTARINGSDAIPNFQYGMTSGGYLTLPAGVPILVEVVLPGGSVAISDTVALVADTDYTMVAIGDGVNQPLELFAFIDDNSPPPAGQAKLRIAHLAPISDTLAGTEVDIRTDDGTPLAVNVPYKDFTDPYVPLPTGTYDLKITTPGGGTTLVDLDPVVLTDGEIVGAFAIGDGTNQPLQVVILNQSEPSTGRVWVAHLAPFTDTLQGTAVTVRVNGIVAIPGIRFGESTGGYGLLPATTALVEIVLPGGQVVLSDTFALAPDTDNTVTVIGDGVNQPLELFALIDDNSPPPTGQAKVRIAHLAPISDTLAGTEVDIRTDDGTPLAVNVPYKDFTDPYVPLPVGTYDLKLTSPGGGTTLLDLEPISLLDGEILGVFAIGDGTNQPLSVLPLIYAPGQIYCYLPILEKN
jgi:hypothetical protein